MRLWFEIGLIFLDCVLLSLSCVVYAYSRLSYPTFDREPSVFQQYLLNLVRLAPFGVFALGAVIHTRLHEGTLAPLPGLLIVAVFVIYPLAGFIIAFQLEIRRRLMRAISSGWGRPVDLASLGIKTKEGS
jgi:hypothetical protein